MLAFAVLVAVTFIGLICAFLARPPKPPEAAKGSLSI
jgi:hypothetical protein